jgi:hypothetical protein
MPDHYRARRHAKQRSWHSDIAVVIPSWRDPSLTLRVLSITESAFQGATPIVIVVEDDRPAPEVVNRLKAHSVHPYVLPLASRAGVPGAINVGQPLLRRHTFATFALRAGISTFDLCRYMGASLSMIDRHYGHLARDGREQAIKLLDGLNAPWTLVDARWTPKEPISVSAENESDV